MAIVWGIRALIVLTPVVVRLVQVSSGPGAERVTQFSADIWHQLHDPTRSPEELSATLSESVGYGVSVADLEGTFELRLAQVHWSRDSGAAGGTDDAITTHHFVKLAAGAPVAWDDAADLAAIEGFFLTAWNAIKDFYPPVVGYKSVRWYKAGPDIVPPQPPVRVHTVSSVGTGSTGSMNPPQDAMSITEKTSDPKSWGRFYLPIGNGSIWCDGHGRFPTGVIDAVAAAWEAFYDSCRTNLTPCVVYSAAKPERTTKAGATLAAIEARALGIDTIQIDDVVDVIRSRRWQQPGIRKISDVSA